MRFRKLLLVAALACFAGSSAIAQSAPDVSVEPYVPRLADIMNALQLRHLKLYFAARAQNWELADFELRQAKAGLTQAALLYSGLPVTNITTLATPVEALSDAVKAKDQRKFMDAFGQLTNGCNACHQTMDRKFIVIAQPTAQPFTNQVFAPGAKK
ncbi:MAG TPA: hypothetical protein VFB02_08640 [Bradyrhizobium sp.]|jgi:hypothetical protein|nr:hypothetical protein [Bradyrhizobium sp.]